MARIKVFVLCQCLFFVGVFIRGLMFMLSACMFLCFIVDLSSGLVYINLCGIGVLRLNID